MKSQPVIMVQVAEPEWTWEVLHAACKLARSCGGVIELVHMIRAEHISYLGSELGYLNLDEKDRHLLQIYADTVEDYGLTCGVTMYQYCSMYEAIVGASDLVAANVVFAKLPKSKIPFWSDCQFEMLRVRLARQDIDLFNNAGVWNSIMPQNEPMRTKPHVVSA